jgi:hypothetical protein
MIKHRPSRVQRLLASWGVLLVTMAACAPALARAPVAKPVTLDTAQKSQRQTTVADGDRQWARRAQRAQLEAAVASWERALTVDGTDWRTAIKLSRALHLFADGWLTSDADRDRRIRTLERAMQVAETGLTAASPAFARSVQGGASIEDAVASVGKAHVGLIFWYATNLGGWVHVQGKMAGMKYRGRLEAMMRRVHTLEPGYFFHGADRFFGAYYASLPGFMGGSVETCERHFLAARDGAPEYPGTYLLMAQFLAPAKKDPDAFDRYLAAVLDARACTADGPRPCIAPGLEAEAAIDQRKARALAKRKSELF